MTSKGFIDTDTVIHFVYIILKRPYGYLDEMGLEEFSTLYSAYVNKTREEYQMQVYIQATGVASAMSGEIINLFETQDEQVSIDKPEEVQAVKGTRDYREQTLSELESIFK